jgi:hypothetical protein
MLANLLAGCVWLGPRLRFSTCYVPCPSSSEVLDYVFHGIPDFVTGLGVTIGIYVIYDITVNNLDKYKNDSH